ncbi:Mu transposase C-terminal domain-containing protein [Lignipirellula cremea]|uniref:Transposon Tn7 transposition protein TnsB n=1 Tax=Lignipirellula cremea TaxID=2528010 RepID=A0A518DKH1_9BACT|nr:DDE-type integrase/transposase/recombinase [Lignipirellula cremea]QDU92330.1 Transposon Tn7 transposition protein TnsB [Lignipirellula cremea]
MGSIRLGVGVEWLLDGRAFRVVRQTAAHEFIACDLKFNQEETLSEQQILALYSAGRLRFASGDSLPENAIGKPATVRDLTPRQQRQLRQRWRAIEPLTVLNRPPNQEDYSSQAETLRRQGARCSMRTLRRYFTTWLEAGKDRMALVSGVARRGGRGRARKTSILKQYPALRQLVEEAIQSVYLTTARRPISAVARRVLDDLARQNARRPAEYALPIPREATLNRAIGRRIAQLDPWEVDRARWGRKIADRRHQPTQRQQLARRILERVEIDHTPLKVVVGNAAGPIGQPWLTVLVDYYSRLVVGFCLGFEPPSYGVVMEALRHAILPKSYLAETYPRISGAWPCFGLPEKLVCDRGADLISRDLQQAAFQLGIELDFNPPRTPHFKGTVESFFDALNDQLGSSLPGRTFRSWEKRADYQPDDGPLMPYEALLEAIHIHLVDIHAASKHPTSGKTRFEMWQESAAEFPPCLPAAPEDLLVLLSKQAERTLSARGIELGGMFYMSDELMALRAELAAQNLNVDRLQVRYNPWNLGEAWVLNPINQRYLCAPAVDTAMQGLTEYQWRVLKRAIRERFDDPDHLLSLAAGRNAIREVIEATLHQPSRKRRSRAARFLGPQPLAPQLTEEDWIDVDATAPPSSSSPPAIESPAPEGTSTVTSPAPEPPIDIEDADLDVDDWDIA